MTNVNEVILQGIIVHKFVTDKVAILTIGTGNATRKPNYPKVVCFNEVKDDVRDLFELGDRVRVTGNIQSSKYKKEIKNQNTLSVFAEKVEPAFSTLKSEFEDADISNEGYIPSINKFKVAGKVVRVESPSDGIVRLTVSATKNNRISFIKLTYFVKDVDSIMTTYNPGDQVFAIGVVQTVKKGSDVVKHFENYVVTSLSKTEIDSEKEE